MPVLHANFSCAGQRSSNEDEGFSSRRIIAVADGVSSSPDAQLAAKYAIAHAVDHLHSLNTLNSDAIHGLPRAVSRALACSTEDIDPDAATCLALAILNEARSMVWMTAIGDCRVALYHQQPGLTHGPQGPELAATEWAHLPAMSFDQGPFHQTARPRHSA